jgi:ribonuclease HI
MKTCVAYIDGGSRGNPGVAGYGVAVRDEAGQTVASLFENLGIRTNNFAEYSALLGALRYAESQGYEGIKIFADSELLVKQILGVYKVKSADLKLLYAQATALIEHFKSFSIQYVPRDENLEADRLANLAMDQGTATVSKRTVSSTRRILAVFRQGCFQPLEPVEFSENSRFYLTIKPAEIET